ncbi:hypothetical protein ADIARSV_0780 [Arcticibacter svalbardensis MN12-7]|uniref:Outer membrane protein beta-barrel domain-containing protein n=1 Tax=Arcticibacter svalbardensis MN12-7 TaxID=1150600 RepID=R9H4C9_9SPHI|nr:hypothetical protein [Arcticibacter svalbardensis]EOR96034.1 hypothetical protein ADIARSV_0780 [Arcticibacter svalbardensis MN12-7]
MKHLFLSCALSLFVYAASAQITTPQTSSASQATALQAGNWMIGAGLGSTNYNFDTETFNISVQPKAAYFISDNIAVGAQVNLGLSAYDGGSSFQYGVAPLVRYYFPEGATPTSRWFAEGTVGIGGSHVKDNDNDEPVSLLLGISGGYSHFVSRTVALEAVLGYTYNKSDVGADTGMSGLGLTLGFNIYLPGQVNR